MTDPAIEAARQAFLEQWPEQGEFEFSHSTEGRFGRDAAREALKPIRAILDQLAADTEPPCDFAKRIQLEERAISDLSPLVYPSGELGVTQ